MITISHEVDVLRNGTRVLRNYFLNDKKQSILKDTYKEFSKSSKKEAKLNYNISKRNNVMHQKNREELISYFLKQEFPNLNLKFSLLR